jgi:hypothetical protein
MGEQVYVPALSACPDLTVTDGEDGKKEVLIKLSFSKDFDRNVFLFTELSDFELDGEICSEIAFGYEVISLSGSHADYRTFERDVLLLLHPEVRAEVLNLVMNSLEKLINTLSPKRLFWVANGQNIPEKAARKYEMLERSVKNLGYTVCEAGTDQYGRRFCLMQKLMF